MVRDIFANGDEVFGEVYMRHDTLGVTALDLATRYLGMGIPEALNELHKRGSSGMISRGEQARRLLTKEVPDISIFD